MLSIVDPLPRCIEAANVLLLMQIPTLEASRCAVEIWYSACLVPWRRLAPSSVPLTVKFDSFLLTLVGVAAQMHSIATAIRGTRKMVSHRTPSKRELVTFASPRACLQHSAAHHHCNMFSDDFSNTPTRHGIL